MCEAFAGSIPTQDTFCYLLEQEPLLTLLQFTQLLNEDLAITREAARPAVTSMVISTGEANAQLI